MGSRRRGATPSLWSQLDPRVRARLRRATLARHGPTCWLCHKPINLALPRRHPGCYTVDHVVAPGNGGSLVDLANLRPAHYGCNAGKRNRPAPWRPRLEW